MDHAKSRAAGRTRQVYSAVGTLLASARALFPRYGEISKEGGWAHAAAEPSGTHSRVNLLLPGTCPQLALGLAPLPLASPALLLSSSSSLVLSEAGRPPGLPQENDGQVKAFPSYLNNTIKAPAVEMPPLAAHAGEELKWERP